MAKERTSVRMQAQIKTLSEQGYSIRRIARILRLSRKTVRKFLEPATEPICESGGLSAGAQAGGWVEAVDWEYVRQEVYGKGTTVKQIGREVAPEIAYVKFWRVFREKAARQASPNKSPSGFIISQQKKLRSIFLTVYGSPIRPRETSN